MRSCMKTARCGAAHIRTFLARHVGGVNSAEIYTMITEKLISGNPFMYLLAGKRKSNSVARLMFHVLEVA